MECLRKAFCAAEGDQISGSLLIYGVLPTILHEDPRYFRKGRGSTISRMWYADNRTFFARRDNGTSGFNNSEAFGQLISCGTRNRTAASATSSPIGA
jgi:hypothetical protein